VECDAGANTNQLERGPEMFQNKGVFLDIGMGNSITEWEKGSKFFSLAFSKTQ